MTTLGAFIEEKVGNMCNWLILEGFETRPIPELPQPQLMVMCDLLREHYQMAIENRSFGDLYDGHEHLPEDFRLAIKFVQDRPSLHDKFWRYLALFSDSVSGA